MDGIECFHCGHVNSDDAIYCENCGVELSRPGLDPETDLAFFPVVAQNPETDEPETDVPETDVPETDVPNADHSAPKPLLAPKSVEFEVAQRAVEQKQGDQQALPYNPTLPWQMDKADQLAGVNTNLELEAEPAAPIPAKYPADSGSLEPEIEGSEDPGLIYSPGTLLDEPEPEPIPSVPLPPMALLIAEAGERFELPDLPVLYMGKPNDQIPVQVDLSRVAESEIISRVHAVIHRFKHEDQQDQAESFFLEDAGSLNGTFLNGEPLQPGTRHRKPLNPGDVVTFGRKRQITFRFEVETRAAKV
ncbi:MAG: FHA domain-containing protein [Synechococcaceae cyanobacterium SM2_3_2]|nr:FHA domain-containing protein [Synechococcaceae cyanobacterium SM2_3_2]